MSNGYAIGIPVPDPPDWLKALRPSLEWRLLMPGVCEICEIRHDAVWQTSAHGYTYCRACIERFSSYLDVELMS